MCSSTVVWYRPSAGCSPRADGSRPKGRHMDLGLAGASAVVQGGTQGMGRAAAECFAADGARVGVLARTQADLDATVEQLLALGAPDAMGLRADITKPDEVVAAFS